MRSQILLLTLSMALSPPELVRANDMVRQTCGQLLFRPRPIAKTVRLTPAERTAEETIAHIEKHGRAPFAWTSDSGFFYRYTVYKKDPAFLAKLKENPKAWEIFLREKADKVAARAENAAELTIRHIREFGIMPRNLGAESTLYSMNFRYRDHEAFIAKMREDPLIWKVFRGNRTPPAEKTAEETIAFIEKHQRIPFASTMDSGLYQRYTKYKDNPQFLAKLKENPKVWEIFQKPAESIAAQRAEEVAERVIHYLTTYGHIPKNGGQKKSPFAAYLEVRDNEIFLARLRKDPAIWQVYEKYLHTLLSPPVRAAVEVAEYVVAQRRIPTFEVEPSLYLRVRKYAKHPDFIAKLKENPEAWDLFEQRWEKYKSGF